MSETKIGQVISKKPKWAILSDHYTVAAVSDDFDEATEIVCKRMECDWQRAVKLGFHAVRVSETLTITGILHE